MAALKAAKPRTAGHPLVAPALDAMPQGVCIWDRSVRLAYCNAAFLRIYRVRAGAIRQHMTLLEVIEVLAAAGNYPGRSAADIASEYRARLAGRRRSNSYERPSRDGRVLRVTSRPIRGGAWLTIFEDVTEIRSYIDALREREEAILLQNTTFDFVVSNMRQGLCMYDAEERLVFFNHQYVDMYNMPRDSIKRGDTLQQVLQVRLDAGNRPIGGNATWARDRRAPDGAEKPSAFVVKMEDGRAYSILRQPLKGGGWVATHFDITEERRNEERIHYLARHDVLTGLPNRLMLHERMQDVEALIRGGEVVAVLCVDLDHFKTANDSLGHAIGDDVLKEVASRLRACTRECDVVARFGGDEFIVLSGPLRMPDEATVIAERIVDAIGKPFHVQGHEIVIGASVGIAVGPQDGHTADVLLKAADLACYRAKRDGRGGFEFFQPDMDAAARDRRQLEVWLRLALARKQFKLDFQPIFDLANDRIVSMEALLRWRHPERGLIPPSEFIPVAEDTGLIVPIGEWVVRHACRVAADWPADVKVAVNLSAIQFKKDGRLAETVVSALASAGLKPERLELEITESALLFETEGVLKTLHRLRELGVKICMDDFGTGYSSLSYLQSFPFDKIKIDRSFIESSTVRAGGTAIVRAVVGLGRSLGMSITAEGVETPDQLELVRIQGCNEAQGYLLGRPCPSESLPVLFQTHRAGQRRASAAAPGRPLVALA